MNNLVKVIIAAVFIAIVFVFLFTERESFDVLMSTSPNDKNTAEPTLNENIAPESTADTGVSIRKAEVQESVSSLLTEVEMTERSDTYRAQAEQYSENLNDEEARDQLSSSLKNDQEYKKAILDKFKQERDSKLGSE